MGKCVSRLCAVLVATFCLQSSAFAQNSQVQPIRKSAQRLAFENSYREVGTISLEAFDYQKVGLNKDACVSYRSALSLVNRTLQSLGSLVLSNEGDGAFIDSDHNASEEMGKAKELILEGINETCNKENTYTAPVSGNYSNKSNSGKINPADGFDFNGALSRLQTTIDGGYNSALEAVKFYQSSQTSSACQSAKSAQSAYEKAAIDARDILGRRNYARYINIADIDRNSKQAALDVREFYCK